MAAESHENSLQVGYLLHWYRIERVLGQGGFGITYLAHDQNLDQAVAIKEYIAAEMAVRRADASVQPLSEDHLEQYRWGLERFISEARTLARFDHPNIVRVHSVFEENNTAYMVMRYEQGDSLQALLEARKTMPEAILKEILFPVLDGLEQVHAAGFIHRDIKPANIYIRTDGSPVLIDFGSARQALGEITRTLTTIVSPGYAPFEQYYTDSEPQGPWTDIYALAATAYRAVTGVAPLSAVDRSKTLLRGAGDFITPAIETGAGRYSEPFLRAIDHGLAFHEQDRPQSIDAWRRELRNEVTVPAVVTPPAQVPDSEAETRLAGADETVRLDRPLPGAVADTVVDSTGPAAPRPAKSRKRRWFIGLGLLLLVFVILTQGPRDERAGGGDAAPDVDRPVAPSGPAETVDDLLAAARQDLEDDKLTRPPGDNANEKFRQVLALDGGNADAQQGLEQIVGKYLNLARNAARHGALDKADDYLRRAAQVAPDAPAIREAREMLRRYREERAADRLVTRQASQAPVSQTLEQRARAGDADAQYRLGMQLLTGGGGRKAVHEGIKWLRKAADQGQARASFNLGRMYLRGTGVKRDMRKARHYLEQAAAAGMGEALQDLGAGAQR